MDSTLSMRVFGAYLALLSASLLFWPALYLRLGFAELSQPWMALCGYLVGIVALFHLLAVRARERHFYRWTVMARLPLLPFAVLLVALQLAPPVLILLGVVDLLGALWTGLALRREAASRGRG